MQEFFDIAKTDFMDTFGGAWLFPLLAVAALWILWQEKDLTRKLLLGALPLIFLLLYWCPLTGILFMKILGENVYWRILWLLLPAATIPYGGCLLLKKLTGLRRYGAFLLCLAGIVLCGKNLLSEEWFEPSTNVYKIPQYVVEVGELLPDHVHAMVSNRVMPYIRMYNPTITLAFGRNALIWNGMEAPVYHDHMLYLEAQKEEIDLDVLIPLAEEMEIEFFVFSNNRTYLGEWEAYGYKLYGSTNDFNIYARADWSGKEPTERWKE